MMLSLAVDENFNAAIIRGLLRRNPSLDVLTVQEAGLSGATDPQVLDWPTVENRLLLTQDVQTMLSYAFERLMAALPCCGIVEVSRNVLIGTAIDDLLLIAECSFPGE
jgi:hypothetical protein